MKGFMMITLQGFLRGHALRAIKVLTGYGPVYYLYEWLIHAGGLVPLTHDTTRLLCVLHWLAASCLLGSSAGLLTKSPLTGLFAFMQAILHLNPITREPGHPQELVVILLAFAAFWLVGGFKRPWTFALQGAICAAAFLITRPMLVYFSD